MKALSKKLGPLPVWAWGLIALVGIVVWRMRQAGKAAVPVKPAGTDYGSRPVVLPLDPAPAGPKVRRPRHVPVPPPPIHPPPPRPRHGFPRKPPKSPTPKPDAAVPNYKLVYVGGDSSRQLWVPWGAGTPLGEWSTLSDEDTLKYGVPEGTAIGGGHVVGVPK